VKLDWQSTESAAAYKESRRPDHFKRYHQEQAILQGWLSDLPKTATILDAPCGTGRWIPFLLPLGYRYIGADVSVAMIEQARPDLGTSTGHAFVNMDMEALPFADNSVDCLIIWRFLHHVTNAKTRVKILGEAARVARDRVLLSFHHPLSLTHARKSLDTLTGRKVHRGQAVTHWQLEREAKSCGLEMKETKSFGKFLSINWFAYLKKP
jgi:ubiquinone/menaquinone biosynthesis C-methylase UbiE